jgi:RNA polymerase sigma factor (sigma-70 family)
MFEPEQQPRRAETREEVFTRRYPQLLAWALRLTNQRRAAAEDLVQDAFIQFTRTRTSLDEIENVDGYLHRMLRNINLSRLSRFAEQLQQKTISIAEQELLQLDSHIPELQQRLQSQQQLERICQYACARKETSRAGGVVILRFFFEYTPTEIARVLCCSRHCVDEWQRFARRELKAYLEDPQCLKFVNAQSIVTFPRIRFFNEQKSLPDQLRQLIQSSCRGECVKTDKLEKIYQSQQADALSSERVGHIVSCSICLDKVNQILGFPSLAQRYKSEPRHPQKNPPDNHGGGSGGDSNGGSSEGPTDLSTQFRQRLDEVVHNRPKELRISVNGAEVGSITINSLRSELILNLPPHDQIHFVEIHSEQGVRLLFLSLGKPSVEAEDQWAEIELSEQRVLSAYLSADSDAKALRISYVLPSVIALTAQPSHVEIAIAEKQRSFWSDFQEWLTEALWSLRIDRWKMKLALTILCLALLAAAAVLFFKPAPSGKGVLEESQAREKTRSLSDKLVTYHVVQLEQLNDAGNVFAIYKVETWRDPLRNRRTRLVYNDSNLLISATWEPGDGSRIVYHHGSKLMREPSAGVSQFALNNEPWLLELSAGQFQSIVGEQGKIQLQESISNYTIRWDADQTAYPIGNTRLLTATLTLNKLDLHPVAQSFRFERDGEIHEYRFVEQTVQRFRESDVSPEVFEPATSDLPTAPIRERMGARSQPARASVSTPLHSKFASTELEIEATYLLDKAKGDRNEQISLTRIADGSLTITGVVDTIERKAEILQSLSPLRTNALVRIHLLTVSDLSPQQRSESSSKTAQQNTDQTPDEIAVDQDLRRYFAKSKSRAEVETAIGDFSSQVVDHAYRALFEAIELQRLTSRFAGRDLPNVAPEARFRWLELVRSRATAFQGEIKALRMQIKPVFFAGEPEVFVEVNDQIDNDRELGRAIERLHRLALANNETIRAAFTISSNSSSATIKSNEFWRSLINAEQLAQRVRLYGN